MSATGFLIKDHNENILGLMFRTTKPGISSLDGSGWSFCSSVNPDSKRNAETAECLLHVAPALSDSEVAGFYGDMRWNVWSSGSLGPTSSCAIQYCKPDSHTTSSCGVLALTGGNRSGEKSDYRSLTHPF